MEPSRTGDDVKTVVLRNKDHGKDSSRQAPRGSPLVPGAEVGGRYRIDRGV